MTPISRLDPDKNLAWYLKAIHQLGFPIVVAGVLLYTVLSGLVENAEATRHEVQAVRQELTAHVATAARNVEQLSAEAKTSGERLSRIMQQICVNTAQTLDERRGCFPQ